MKTREIQVSINGSYEKAILNLFDNEIIIKIRDRKLSKKGEYPFIVLKEIRKQLESENIFLIVNGSRIDVYPSGLSLHGFNAYTHVMGRQTSLDQLVDILEETDQKHLIGTVGEQMEYHAKWIETLNG